MKRFVAMTAVALLAASAASARDPLAPLDTPSTTPTMSVTYSQGSGTMRPNAFGSVALRAGVTIYDARFRRVSTTDAKAPVVLDAAKSLRGLSPSSQLVRAQQIVSSRVRYMSDPDAMRVSDLWANAGETLISGRGDDEDIAIVEMQVLKAAGFPSDDLYLSVGRHSTNGMHTVLLARTAEGFYMLDHLAPAPILVNSANREFKPVVTIGADGSWVHGFRRPSLKTASR